MTALKAHQVDRYVARAPQHALALVYGPDDGLVHERADRLARGFGIDPDDPFATVRLDADDAAAEPGRVYEEATSISMFGGKRLVRVRGSTQRNLARALAPVMAEPPRDALVIVEAGDLKPGTGLRKAVEGSPNGVALPCYPDEGAALDTVIDEELREAGLSIEREARDALRSMLGGDRLASRGEVRKLALYAHGQDTVTLDDVEAIVGDASLGATDRFVDAVATGRAADAESEMRTLLEGGTSTVALAGALQRHFHLLHRARAGMDRTGRSADGVVGALRPPVNFKRKPDVVRALQVWRMPALTDALGKLDTVAFRVRASAELGEAYLATAVMTLVRTAARG